MNLIVFRRCGVLVCMICLAAGPPPTPDPDAAWAAAFAGVSQRLCGAFEVDSMVIYDSGGLYMPELPEWADKGSSMLAFRVGGLPQSRPSTTALSSVPTRQRPPGPTPHWSSISWLPASPGVDRLAVPAITDT